MYEFMIDTANVADIGECLDKWPVSGVTTNPSILKKEGDVDLYPHLAKIKALCGSERSLHVQVVSEKTDDMIAEAQYICEKLGRDVYIKVPVSEEGVVAIKKLSAMGINVTATAVYSTFQGIMAVLAGAKYVAVYYNRMENNCVDPCAVICEIRAFIDNNPNSDARLLGASFKNAGQVTSAFAAGCHSVTVGVDVVKTALGMASIDAAVKNFASDFFAIHGENTNMTSV